MGMYCCCGVKKREGWVCECDWQGWFLCYELDNLPIEVPIKKIPDKDEIYEVRIFEDGDDSEVTSRFSTVAKNWGQCTNKAISNWEIEYDDKWSGFIGVFAWKEKSKE